MSGDLRDQALDAAHGAIERAPVEKWIDAALEKANGLGLPRLVEQLAAPFLSKLREKKRNLADYTRSEVLDFLDRVATGESPDQAVPERFEDRIALQEAANRELHADTLERMRRRAELVGFLQGVGKDVLQVGLAILASAAKDELTAAVRG